MVTFSNSDSVLDNTGGTVAHHNPEQIQAMFLSPLVQLLIEQIQAMFLSPLEVN